MRQRVSARMSQPAQHVRRDLSWCIDIAAAQMSQPASEVSAAAQMSQPAQHVLRRDL